LIFLKSGMDGSLFFECITLAQTSTKSHFAKMCMAPTCFNIL